MRDEIPATDAVDAQGLVVRYGAVTALKGVDVAIAAGEYFVLLGPSGGGKTTLLRTVGGFIRPDQGRVRLMGADVTDLPPDRRPTGMVFQSYALFPHMTVAQNVAYGLKLRKTPREEMARAVDAGLAQVGMATFGDRRIWELSGGQQQRVQLARALVLRPAILLLDEPLAALDAKLRKEMCYELKHLQEKVGITFIHVTHNQDEAMTVADHIALVADGELVEQGAPRDVYERPRRRFTADFVGERNLFEGKVVSVSGTDARVETAYGPIDAPLRGETPVVGASAAVSIRSEAISLTAGAGDPDGTSMPAAYAEMLYLGLVTQQRALLHDGREIAVRALSDAPTGPAFDRGADVSLTWRREDALLHVT